MRGDAYHNNQALKGYSSSPDAQEIQALLAQGIEP